MAQQPLDWAEIYQGASWVRVDLHLHSPGAHSFKFPSGLDANQREEVVQQYVSRLKAQGIAVAAITDYQQIRSEWFLPIRDVAREAGIYVYPGVELSFGGSTGGKGGVHILAVFPFDADVDRINRLIDKLHKSGEPLVNPDGNHNEIIPERDLAESLQWLRRETGCILIFAHPHDSKGIFKSFRPKEAAKILAAVQPEAIEDYHDDDSSRLRSTGEIGDEILARIASVCFSDNHSIEEIGAKQRSDGTYRATYLKLSALDDLRAIRLALRDHEILVRVGEKPTSGYTHLETVEVEGSGFLGDLRLALSPELNVLIGGRGVGKSALLEVIRYGLDLPPYVPTEYREGLVHYALGSGGKVTLALRQVVNPGVERRYRIERVLGEETRVYELGPHGDRLVPLSVADVLEDQEMPLFFGQRVLYDVAQSPRLRRQLLDELIGKTARQKLGEITKIEQLLRRNARRLMELEEKRLRREEVEQRLHEIEHEVQLFKRYGVTEKLRAETALTRDEERLKRAEALPPQFLEEWQEMQKRWQARWQSTLADLEQAESQQKALLQQEATRVIRELQKGLTTLFQQGTSLLEKTRTQFAKIRQQWDKGRQAMAEDLRRIRQELGDEALDPEHLVALTREEAQLEQELHLLRQAEAEAKRLLEERQHLLQRLRDVRREAFRLRAARAREITRQIGSRVKIEVRYRGQRKEYAKTLAEFFGGSRIPKKHLERLAHNEEIADGLALAELARKGKKALEEKSDLSEARAQQLIEFLNQEQSRWYELELLSPEDEVQVSLKVNEHWVAIEKLSAGQRATAMLLILLTQAQRPLMIDQPEDDLDNRFIYEEVVKLLRAQKGKRQLITATHNPNIPVLAHAELIVALEAGSEHARIAVQGGMDHPKVQNEVRRVMEGGAEAFRRRAEKYGLEL